MRQMLVTTLLIAAIGSLAGAQSQVLVIAGNNSAETRWKHAVSDLKCTVLDGAKSSTFSVTTARSNAQKIQEALAAGYCVLLPPDRIAIADHDNDQIDIKWPEKYGLALVGTGITDVLVRTAANQNGIGGTEHVSALVHIDNPLREDYDECMLQYSGYGGEIACCFIGAHSDFGRTAEAMFDADQNAQVAIRFLNTASSPPGNKMLGTAHITNCQIGCQFTYDTLENHTDHMEWNWLGFRFVKTHYQVLNCQSMDHHINMYTNSGSPTDVAFDFQKGGDLLVDYAYAPNGTLLRVGDAVATNQGDFRFTKIRMDANISTGDDTILLDNQDMSSEISVRIGGLLASENFNTRQLFRSKSGAGRLDLQVDVANLGSERAAYPMRPIRGQAVDDYYETRPFPSTKLWFDPNNRGSGWAVSGTKVVEAGDLAGTQAFSQQTSAGPTLVADGCNWRDCISRESSDGPLWDQSPSELASINDLTIMAVAHTESVAPGTKVLLSYENADGSDRSGFQIKRAADKIVFEVGADDVTSTNSIEAFRWYLIVARRDGSTGRLYVTVDGVTTSEVANHTAGAIADPTGPLVIAAEVSNSTGSFVSANHWTRQIGPILIDLDFWAGDDNRNGELEVGEPAAQYLERLHYLRQWGVW